MMSDVFDDSSVRLVFPSKTIPNLDLFFYKIEVDVFGAVLEGTKNLQPTTK